MSNRRAPVRRLDASRPWLPRRRQFEPDQEKRMERYLPLAAALLALPHLLAIAIRDEPAAAAAARTPRAVAATAPVRATAHCAAALPRGLARLPTRAAGTAAAATRPYLQP
ncbi:hypothetical protein [Lysobacter enzymogenes]|uniref:hypothetical protein n=1 Tax=Lysobacter enzymogenes TaxID=69 RepID=UPI001A975DA6|nr:hypothetical protein [Lysobacter enzymogenes]QQP97472.1 hypothetical protein JHW38_05470 [Lysobacter enzymogenes]